MADGWSTIESEPAVFHQLIREFGVSGVSVSQICPMRTGNQILHEDAHEFDLQVEELWSLDSESLHALQPVHGLVFLFKWTAEPDPRTILHQTEGKMFFAKQVRGIYYANEGGASVAL